MSVATKFLFTLSCWTKNSRNKRFPFLNFIRLLLRSICLMRSETDDSLTFLLSPSEKLLTLLELWVHDVRVAGGTVAYLLDELMRFGSSLNESWLIAEPFLNLIRECLFGPLDVCKIWSFSFNWAELLTMFSGPFWLFWFDNKPRFCLKESELRAWKGSGTKTFTTSPLTFWLFEGLRK